MRKRSQVQLLSVGRTGGASLRFPRTAWLRPFTSLAGLLLVAPLLVAPTILSATVGTRPATAQTVNATTPPNQNAYIFNTFGQESNYVSSDTAVQKILDDENYQVKLYQNTATGVGNATLSNLFNLKSAGILIINSHAGAGGLDVDVYGVCKYPVILPKPGQQLCNKESNGVVDPTTHLPPTQ